MIYISLLFPLMIGMFTLKCSAFDIDQLNTILYDVDMNRYPMRTIDERYFSLMPITSKSGKKYECFIPEGKENLLSEKLRKRGKKINMQKLLKDVYDGCLYKVKDWWTYELCFGKAIRQFHIEDGKITGEVLTLGLYKFDKEWNTEIPLEKFQGTKPYHSQLYVNGTKCDLTGLPRTSEIRIFCEEGSLDYINWITEPETCNYVITVHTSALCPHPVFKPLQELHTIACHPTRTKKKREQN